MEFRLIKAEEIDVRVGTINPMGLTLLLYQDARVGMNILDETVKPENWQRKHELIDGDLFCSVGINVNYAKPETPERWVWKQDVGTENQMEKEKSRASDSFKRAVVNWGIARELYSAPFIWIDSENANIKTNKAGKQVCYDNFIVEQILYDEKRNIVALSIKNASKNKRVFLMDKRKKAE